MSEIGRLLVFPVNRLNFIEVPVPCQESEHHLFVRLRYRFCLFLRFRYLILELFRQCGIFFTFHFFMLHWNQRLRGVFIYLNSFANSSKGSNLKIILFHHDELAQESLKKICLTSSLPSSLSWIFYSACSLKQQSADRHVASLVHIILIQSQPVFAVSP